MVFLSLEILYSMDHLRIRQNIVVLLTCTVAYVYYKTIPYLYTSV